MIKDIIESDLNKDGIQTELKIAKPQTQKSEDKMKLLDILKETSKKSTFDQPMIDEFIEILCKSCYNSSYPATNEIESFVCPKCKGTEFNIIYLCDKCNKTYVISLANYISSGQRNSFRCRACGNGTMRIHKKEDQS